MKNCSGLRIHSFGYPSPKKPRLPFSVTRVPDYDDIAQTLATEYATVLADASDIAVVTHSQGGLILQRFLAWMVSEGRARELCRIRSVVMLACPNGGSEYLKSLRRTLGYGRHPQAGSLQVLDRQVADTQRTVLQRIVNAPVVDDTSAVSRFMSTPVVPTTSSRPPPPRPYSRGPRRSRATTSRSSTRRPRATALRKPSSAIYSPTLLPRGCAQAQRQHRKLPARWRRSLQALTSERTAQSTW